MKKGFSGKKVLALLELSFGTGYATHNWLNQKSCWLKHYQILAFSSSHDWSTSHLSKRSI